MTKQTDAQVMQKQPLLSDLLPHAHTAQDLQQGNLIFHPPV